MTNSNPTNFNGAGKFHNSNGGALLPGATLVAATEKIVSEALLVGYPARSVVYRGGSTCFIGKMGCFDSIGN